VVTKAKAARTAKIPVFIMEKYAPFSDTRQQGSTLKAGSGAAVISHLGSVYVGCAEQPVVSPVRDVWGTRLVITDEMEFAG
jgi:hypothetical protein